MAIAAAITNIAAAPAIQPVIAYIATANIANEPAKATKLLPISSQDCPPSMLKAILNPISATLIAPRPTDSNNI